MRRSKPAAVPFGAAERLDAAVQGAPPADMPADELDLLDVAQMLRPAEVQSEGHRAMLRARLVGEPASSHTHPMLGAGDDAFPTMSTQTVDSPLGALVLADIEEITPERAERTAAALARILDRSRP